MLNDELKKIKKRGNAVSGDHRDKLFFCQYIEVLYNVFQDKRS